MSDSNQSEINTENRAAVQAIDRVFNKYFDKYVSMQSERLKNFVAILKKPFGLMRPFPAGIRSAIEPVEVEVVK